MQNYTVPLSKLAEHLDLETVYTPTNLEDIMICSPNVNRPGLIVTGYSKYFDSTRVQIIGLMETSYLSELTPELRAERVDNLFARKPPVIILSHGVTPLPEFLTYGEKHAVPVLRSMAITSVLMGDIINFLSLELAPRITRHGVLVDVYGEGILILGDSGVGKSETAIELVKRGHRLVADDAVELRRLSDHTIVGTSPENIRHFIELRGVGIINVARVFGIGAVKPSERVDMIVELEPWDKAKNYSRIGLESETMELLSVPIPYSVIPVRPGRNLAVILEIAAMNNRQKKMGYNAAEELLEKLGMTND